MEPNMVCGGGEGNFLENQLGAPSKNVLVFNLFTLSLLKHDMVHLSVNSHKVDEWSNCQMYSTFQ